MRKSTDKRGILRQNGARGNNCARFARAAAPSTYRRFAATRWKRPGGEVIGHETNALRNRKFAREYAASNRYDACKSCPSEGLMHRLRLALGLVLVTSTLAWGEDFLLNKVIDTSALMPNGPGNFTEISPPVVQDGKVGFIGFASAGP